jgi:hypothetical protein
MLPHRPAEITFPALVAGVAKNVSHRRKAIRNHTVARNTLD